MLNHGYEYVCPFDVKLLTVDVTVDLSDRASLNTKSETLYPSTSAKCSLNFLCFPWDSYPFLIISDLKTFRRSLHKKFKEHFSLVLGYNVSLCFLVHLSLLQSPMLAVDAV